MTYDIARLVHGRGKQYVAICSPEGQDRLKDLYCTVLYCTVLYNEDKSAIGAEKGEKGERRNLSAEKQLKHGAN